MTRDGKKLHAVLSRPDPSLRAELRRKGGGRVDVDDVLQDAYVRALSRQASLRNPERAAAWFGRVARHALIDELRRPSPHGDDAGDLAAAEPERPSCACILERVKHLKADQAELLERVDVNGERVTEVAASIGVSPGTAMVRLHRARKALRERLAEHCGTTNAVDCQSCSCGENGCCVT